MRMMTRRQVVSGGVHLAFGAIVISIFLAVSVPAFLAEWNRNRQKRTMADMRTIATALEARATDRNSYAIGTMAGARTSMDDIAGVLVPHYIKTLPRLDGWGNEFEIRVSDRSYVIRSRGSDGRFDGDNYTHRIIKSFREDLVFGNGNFIQYPEGSCAQ